MLRGQVENTLPTASSFASHGVVDCAARSFETKAMRTRSLNTCPTIYHQRYHTDVCEQDRVYGILKH